MFSYITIFLNAFFYIGFTFFVCREPSRCKVIFSISSFLNRTSYTVWQIIPCLRRYANYDFEFFFLLSQPSDIGLVLLYPLKPREGLQRHILCQENLVLSWSDLDFSEILSSVALGRVRQCGILPHFCIDSAQSYTAWSSSFFE